MQEGTSALRLTAAARVPEITPPRIRSRAAGNTAAMRPRVTVTAPSLPMPREEALPDTAPKTKTKTRIHAEARPHMKLSFRTTALFCVAIALLMFIVYSNMEISRINRDNQKLQKELTSLKRQETQLKNQFENSVQLSEVEQYAVSELGMVEPGADQIIYIDLAGEDHAEIIEHKSFWESIMDALSSAMVTAGEFFD